ncbi:vacuolar-sorting protein BRO1-like isoform X2 [Typha angustifolia]|uniref:vacuolar-sorting protein BRO1-like isoform X2 n=1 Tax=Typha angustifolia TaxID=59011 RepID=UPI003C2D3131
MATQVKEKKTTPISSNLLRGAVNASHDLRCSLIKRLEVEKPLADTSVSSLVERLESYRGYIESLSTLEGPTFTVSLQRCGLESLSFTWHDAFKKPSNLLTFWKSNEETHTSIRFEKAAVWFNFAALYSQMAAADWSSMKRIKKACHAFQRSAGAFKFLKEHVLDSEVVLWASVDLSPESAVVLEKLMLAQAEECFFKLAVQTKKSPTCCSMVARQVGLRYQKAYETLNTSPPRVKKHLGKAWVSHLQLKASLFYAEACYHYSLKLHKEEEIGEEIARLRTGISRLSNTTKSFIAKGVDSSLIDAALRLEENMTLKLKRAIRENVLIYSIRVPTESSLIDLPAADSLALSTPTEALITNAMDY